MLASGETVSHYRILEKLGGGGMGVVYKAEDTRLGRTVALKVLPPERVADPNRKRRFVQEARAASALNHPNIITIYDIDEVEGVHFIAMEFVDGKTLDRLIARGLPLDKALKYAVEMAAALTKAHSAGIVHRDLKPTNIMVNNEGLVKVLDFGLAKLIEPTTQGDAETVVTAEPRTEEGTVIGTVGYMSPEQAEGKPVDARSDIFSFGSVLYEMLAGQRAFQGETKVSTIAAILREEPKPLSQVAGGVPREMERVVKRCLRKDREHRFQTIADLKVALGELKEEYDSGELAKAMAAGSGSARPREDRGLPYIRWMLLVAGVLAVIVVGLLITWFVTHRSSPPVPQMTERRLSANPRENPVTTGVISPDGKYLAYSDTAGLHLRFIQSGETINIPQPEWASNLPGSGWWPSGWFPDGSRFIATLTAPGHLLSAWVISVIGGPPRKLRDDADAWTVSPDGTLIAFGTGTGFMRFREIWVMGAQGEEPRRLVSGSEDDGFFWATWSPDGRRIAYTKYHRTPEKPVCSIESRDLEGGQPILVVSDPGLCDFIKPLWYPDGRFIYNLLQPDRTTQNLWEIRVDVKSGQPTGKPRRLTNWTGTIIFQLSGTQDGKQLVVSKSFYESDVYVGELEGNGRRLKNIRRLTLNDNYDYPGGWLPDGKAVLFWSNRNGTWDIFKQALDQSDPQPVATGPDVKARPSASSDGSWILYLSRATIDASPSTLARIMRVPISGGAPEVALEVRGPVFFACAHAPKTGCVFSEQNHEGTQVVFSAFDPVRGREKELTRVNLQLPSNGYWWNLSRDGARIAFAQFDVAEGRIRILPLAGGKAQEIMVKGWRLIRTVNWTADGKGLLVGAARAEGSPSTILYVDLAGHAEVLWTQRLTGWIAVWGVPSPDGRRVALLGWTQENNVWTLENFEQQ